MLVYAAILLPLGVAEHVMSFCLCFLCVTNKKIGLFFSLSRKTTDIIHDFGGLIVGVKARMSTIINKVGNVISGYTSLSGGPGV